MKARLLQKWPELKAYFKDWEAGRKVVLQELLLAAVHPAADVYACGATLWHLVVWPQGDNGPPVAQPAVPEPLPRELKSLAPDAHSAWQAVAKVSKKADVECYRAAPWMLMSFV